MPPQFLIALLLIYFRLDSISSQRFYACEPNCVMDHCEDANNEPVCVHIIEYDPDGRNVEFPSKCAFDCANRCYESNAILYRPKPSLKVHMASYIFNHCSYVRTIANQEKGDMWYQCTSRWTRTASG